MRMVTATLRRNRVPYLLILPSVLVVLAVLLVPLVYGVGFSLFRKTIMMLRPEFVGLANYVELIVHERFFLNSIKNSLIWSVMVVSVTTLISFTSAMLLNQRLRFRRLIRTAILLPWITPMVTAATIWGLIFSDRYGFLNHLLGNVLGIEYFVNFGWLIDRRYSLLSAILVQIWKAFPFYTLAYLAALQSIPRDFYEAAELEGARWFAKLRYVTLPGIRTTFQILVLLNVLWTFKAFTVVYIMTKGGPYHSSEVVGVYAWSMSFFYNRPGLGSASGVIIFVLLLVFARFYLRNLRSQGQL